MEPADPDNQAFVTELHIVCRAEQVAAVRGALPDGMELAEVPGWLPRGFATQPGLVAMYGVVPDGVWTPEAQRRLDDLAQQGTILQQGTSTYRAGTRFVTFEELLSGQYAGQMVAVRQWDTPRPDQLPPGVRVERSSAHMRAEREGPDAGE